MILGTTQLAIRFFGIAFTLCFFATAATADDLNEAEFKRLQRELTASKNDPWRQIPWKISLLDAQHQAAGDQKPIFIWAMDGHPLGCT